MWLLCHDEGLHLYLLLDNGYDYMIWDAEQQYQPLDRLAAILKGPTAKTSVAPPPPGKLGSIPDLGHRPANKGVDAKRWPVKWIWYFLGSLAGVRTTMTLVVFLTRYGPQKDVHVQRLHLIRDQTST